jgi:eukaryotic-like serine/threonine-protein kinase
VGRFRDGNTPQGVADMGGNVREWTASPFCAYPDEACGNELEYVIRGGGWTNHFATTLEATTRDGVTRTDAAEALGFRCAR